MHRFLGALAALIVCSFAANAAAESPVHDSSLPPCAFTAPGIGFRVPANLPGIAFPNAVTASLTAVSLMTRDGTPVATTLSPDGANDAVLSIDEPLLEEKEYVIRWSDNCGSGREDSFWTAPAQPFPTTAGTLSIGELEQKCPDASGESRIFRTAVLNIDPALEPFLPSAKYEFVGISGSTDWGHPAVKGTVHHVEDTCPGASPAARPVSIAIRIAGGPTIPATAVNTTLVCGASPPDRCGAPQNTEFGCAMGDDQAPSAIAALGVAAVAIAMTRRARRSAR